MNIKSIDNVAKKAAMVVSALEKETAVTRIHEAMVPVAKNIITREVAGEVLIEWEPHDVHINTDLSAQDMLNFVVANASETKNSFDSKLKALYQAEKAKKQAKEPK